MILNCNRFRYLYQNPLYGFLLHVSPLIQCLLCKAKKIISLLLFELHYLPYEHTPFID